MNNICFGDGKCIKSRKHYPTNTQFKFYKPFKCPHNCKLIKCFHCEKNLYPLWILQKNNGHCSECLKIKHNGSIMDKIFKSEKIVY